MVLGGLGENEVHVVKRVIDGLGAQHALRESEMRGIDVRVALSQVIPASGSPTIIFRPLMSTMCFRCFLITFGSLISMPRICACAGAVIASTTAQVMKGTSNLR